MGPRHWGGGGGYTSLSALFADNGDIYDLHSLISCKLFLRLPIGWTQVEAEAEGPIDDIHAVQLLGRQQAGKEWRADLPIFPPAHCVSTHPTHWSLI